MFHKNKKASTILIVEAFLIPWQRFELRLTGPKPAVLPLNDLGADFSDLFKELADFFTPDFAIVWKPITPQSNR